MDDLISRKAAIEAITDIALEACVADNETDDNETCKEKSAMFKAHHDSLIAIWRLPSIPAVPLDKLCEWLAGNAWHLDCSDCDSEHCDCPQFHDDSGSSPAFWKAKLTKWMEEQNAR